MYLIHIAINFIDINSVLIKNNYDIFYMSPIIGKAIILQAWKGPEVSRRLRLPDFKTIGT
jgi:hypothetical protein